MKTVRNTIATLMIIGLIGACQNKDQHGHHDHDHDQTENTEHHELNSHEGLELNNGQKWPVDSSTRYHSNRIKALTDSFSPGTLDEYQQLGMMIQEENNALIKGCTMQGPGHDALHIWLVPFLQSTKGLINAASEEEASEALQGISKQVSLYYQYFE